MTNPEQDYPKEKSSDTMLSLKMFCRFFLRFFFLWFWRTKFLSDQVTHCLSVSAITNLCHYFFQQETEPQGTGGVEKVFWQVRPLTPSSTPVSSPVFLS